MRHRWRLVASLWVCTIGAHSNAAWSQANCDTVLQKGLREYEIQSDSSEFLNTTFNNYCSQSGEVKSSSGNVGIEAIIKAVPVKFTGGTTNSSQAILNFCKTYKSETTSKSDAQLYREKIVERGYQSYDNCVALAQNGNLVTHDILSLEKVQIFLRAGIGKPIEIRGVDTSPNVRCTGASDGKQVTYEEATQVKSDTSVTVNCTRTPDQLPNGELAYREGTVAFDIALGKYSIFLPADSKLPVEQASLITASLTEMRTRLQKVEGSKMTCKVATKQSGVGRNVPIEAVIPPGNESAVVTGGGCDIPAFYGHYPPITKSYPTSRGWYCEANDPPKTPLNLSVRAHVVYCTIEN